MFCNFCEKFENSKWPPFLARQKFFQNWDNYSAEIPCGSKISSKLLYLARFSRYKHFCVLQFLRKFRKFKMAAIFGEIKIFWKLGKLLRRDTLRVKNFVEIALSSTVLRYKHFCVLQFLRKFRKFKMAAILGETKIFWKLGKLLRRDTLRVKNFVEIALSSTVFEI